MMNWKLVAAAVTAMCLTACDSYKEPQTDQEWKAFCEAPDLKQRLGAISDESRRQKAAAVCVRAPWIKFVPSKPQSHGF